MTSETDLSIGSHALGRATRPIVAPTEVRASSSGSPAATAAPNTMSRIASVSGSDSPPTVFICFSNTASMALPALADPVSRTLTSSVPAASTARSTLSIWASTAFFVPTSSNDTYAARPAAERCPATTYGEWTLRALSNRLTAATALSTTARNAGSPVFAVFDVTSAYSVNEPADSLLAV